MSSGAKSPPVSANIAWHRTSGHCVTRENFSREAAPSDRVATGDNVPRPVTSIDRTKLLAGGRWDYSAGMSSTRRSVGDGADRVSDEEARLRESRRCDLLFIYGTLLPGLEPAEMSAICAKLEHLAPATSPGKLYDLGPYPGVILDPSSVVKGRVVRVPTDEVWKALEEYEACPFPESPDGLFRRVRTTSTLDNGESIECWVYVYDRPLDGATLIESGCWLTHRRDSRIKPT
jgi:gamma-glutamylcyclotransferase (GGCT)/AIG2-like uncharacterized protein YtfP